MPDVDSLNAGDHLLDFGLVGIAAVQKPGSQLQQRSAERDVHRVRGLSRQTIEIELELLAEQQCAEAAGQRQNADNLHCDTSFRCS